MIFRFRAAPLIALVFAGSASAQAPEAPPVPEREGSMSAPPSEPGESAPPAGPAGEPGQLDADGTYTIKTGDTLWDLSQKFLNNPWYWPKIWADNPKVENPHWIYPGNALRIRQGGEGLPAEAAPVADGEPGGDELPQEPETALAPKTKELADFTTGTLNAENLAGDDLVSVSGSKRGIGIAAPNSLNVRVGSLVTAGVLAEAGTIVASFEQHELLATYDRAYVSFKDLGAVKIGETYSVYRPGAEIMHPVTKASYGFQTSILGSIKIIAKEGESAIAEITGANSYILRGDRVGPAAALDKTVKRVANAKELSGVILTTEITSQTWIGESHVVFVDQGSDQGVKEGNTFTVVQDGDGLEKLDLKGRHTQTGTLPVEPVATLLVFDVRKDSSAAMVVKSLREVGVGDRVEMRAGGSGGDTK